MTKSEVFQGVWRIVTDPVSMDKDIVYAACYGAIMRSEDGGETWAIAPANQNVLSWCLTTGYSIPITHSGNIPMEAIAGRAPGKTGRNSCMGMEKTIF
jgi:hypothetical protein